MERVEDSQNGGTQFRTCQIIKMQLACQEQKVEDTFLKHWLGCQLYIVVIVVNQ